MYVLVNIQSLFRFEDVDVDEKHKMSTALDELEVRPFIYNDICHSQLEYCYVKNLLIFIFSPIVSSDSLKGSKSDQLINRLNGNATKR